MLEDFFFPDVEWELPNGKVLPLEINERIKDLLYDVKKEIKKHYKIKYVEDSFTEDVPSRITVSSKTITIKVSVGGCTNSSNSIIVDRRYKSQTIYDFTTMKNLFIKTIEHFNPEWGVITDTKFTFDIVDQSVKEYCFGWMTYFSKGTLHPHIPLDYKNEHVGDLGKLYITTKRFLM